MKCLANWIELPENDEILIEFPKLNIMNLLFFSLNHPELMENSARCICNFIRKVSENENLMILFDFVFEKVMILFPQ